MKTDRFDDEFRRKLLGLSADTNAGEADRIHAYVQAHHPARPGLGWGRWLLYGAGAALLLGSLSYNIIQQNTAQQLRSSLDSLAQQPRETAHLQVPDLPTPRPDTVYITRYRDRFVAVPMPGQTRLNPARDVVGGKTQQDEPIGLRPEQFQRPGGVQATDSAMNVDAVDVTAMAHQAVNAPNTSSAITPANRLRSQTPLPTATNAAGAGVHESTPIDATRQQLTKKSRVTPDEIAKNEVAKNGRSGGFVAKMLPAKANTKDLLDSKALAGNPATDPATTSEQPASTAFIINLLPARLLASLPEPATALRIMPTLPATAPVVGSAQKSPFRINWPGMSMAGAQYYTGGGLTVANEQLGGSVLGEVRRQRWSLQTGLQVKSVRGYQYYTAEQFEDREGQNFRSQYAPYVPQNYDLLNIDQTYLIVQLPITVAYHYPLGRHWGLRFGLGTDVDVYAHSRITFDYKENNRNFEQGLYESMVPARLLTNITASAGVERSWNRWLFRAGPYISPQVKAVGYRPEPLYWGATGQVLWRVGK